MDADFNDAMIMKEVKERLKFLETKGREYGWTVVERKKKQNEDKNQKEEKKHNENKRKTRRQKRKGKVNEINQQEVNEVKTKTNTKSKSNKDYYSNYSNYNHYDSNYHNYSNKTNYYDSNYSNHYKHRNHYDNYNQHKKQKRHGIWTELTNDNQAKQEMKEIDANLPIHTLEIKDEEEKNTNENNQNVKQHATTKENIETLIPNEEEINVNRMDIENLRSYFEKLKQYSIFSDNNIETQEESTVLTNTTHDNSSNKQVENTVPKVKKTNYSINTSHNLEITSSSLCSVDTTDNYGRISIFLQGKPKENKNETPKETDTKKEKEVPNFYMSPYAYMDASYPYSPYYNPLYQPGYPYGYPGNYLHQNYPPSNSTAGKLTFTNHR